MIHIPTHTLLAIVFGGSFLAISLMTSPLPAQTPKAAGAIELRAPAEFDSIADDKARAAALFLEMGKVIQHPRCLNCHPKGDTPTQNDAMHPHRPPVSRGPDTFGLPGMRCSTCHGSKNFEYVAAEGSIPGHEIWHLAPDSMGWQDTSLSDICRQIKDPERNGGRSLTELVEHNANDGLVGWGWKPGQGREAAPGSQALFGALTKAWVDAGAHCP